ncbi:hypothetical protein [Thalassospira sp.]|uniref:hypothetical protein n=1 Tax=Thalassospira sp. TaxID=1912094 RepID=UPI0032EF6238
MALNASHKKLIDSQFNDLPATLEDQKLAEWLTSDHNVDRIEEAFKKKSRSYSRALVILLICDLLFLTVTNNPDLKFTLFGLNIFKFKGLNEILIAFTTYAFFEFVTELIAAMSLNRLASELINKAFAGTNSFYVHASLGRTYWAENVFNGHEPQQRPIAFRIIYKAAIVSMSLMVTMILILHGYAIYAMSKEIISSQVFDSTMIATVIALSAIINVTALIMFVCSLMIRFKAQ